MLVKVHKHSVICALVSSLILTSSSFARAQRPSAETVAAAPIATNSTVIPPAPVSKPSEGVVGAIDFKNGFANIAEKALPCVVNVATTQVIENKMGDRGFDFPRMMPGSPFEDFFKDFFGGQPEAPRRVQSLGSGFIIRSDEKGAYIVTNFHVITDAKKISVFLHDKTELEATLHASDERTDIAVLYVNTESLPASKRKLPALNWGDSEKLRVGEWVLAIGNPFGLGSTLTAGIVSSKGRDLMAPGRKSDYVDDFIQHSAQINMGNSGGALLDVNGNVVGINTAIFSPSGGNVGIGFAIPCDVARKTVDQLIEFKRTKRGWIGVRVQHLNEAAAESVGLKTKGGAIVGSVTADGPAQKSGMQTGDVIVEFDGKTIGEQDRISRVIGETEIGRECKIKIWRKGQEIELKVVVGEYEDALQKGKIDIDKPRAIPLQNETTELLGMKLGIIPEEVKRRLGGKDEIKGIYIAEVYDANGAAADAKLMAGDIIITAIQTSTQQELSSPDELKKVVEEAKKAGRKNILLLVSRGGDQRFVPLKIEEEKKKAPEADKDSKKNESVGLKKDSSPADESKANLTDKTPSDKVIVPEHPANAPLVAPVT